MRMWMLPPVQMCESHLTQEHDWLHKMLANWKKRLPIVKRVATNQMEPMSYAERHDDLAMELQRRGARHSTPLSQPDWSYLPPEHRTAVVDSLAAQQDLGKACPACAALAKPLPLRKDNTPAVYRGEYAQSRQGKSSRLGLYVPNPPLDPELHTVEVGPFTVRILRLVQHPVYVCTVNGVVITRQRSWPSLGQLCDDLRSATRTGGLERKDVEALWDAVVQGRPA